uniref:MIF4G domain-containing protein n=1 Tax=Schizophyllum commune (strain H4-8 / FGSC 9210) TaxID=578458 RepID=D8Q9X9_SCHCM
MTAITDEPTTPVAIPHSAQQPLNLKLNGAVLSLDAPDGSGTWTLSILPDASSNSAKSGMPWLFRLHDAQDNLHVLSEQDEKHDFSCLRSARDRWQAPSLHARIGAYAGEHVVEEPNSDVVERKVMGLLNKLTVENFDSVSDQIIAWANRSEMETDGQTLKHVIRLILDKATDEPLWLEIYARLCRKMMEQISQKVQEDGIRNSEGKPITGGQLFRKHLLNRCQDDFECGWLDEKAEAGVRQPELYSDEYYAEQKAKRQGLGVIRLIGELFKLQMLTERIMHRCVQKLLDNVYDPEEEEMESLCMLLTTVGELLDNPRARAHMDVYFARMKEWTKKTTVSPRVRFMLQIAECSPNCEECIRARDIPA